jgi:hypothetical protein
VLEDPAELPRQADIHLHRLELDRRQEPRLLVDFTAYTPGLLELPLISLPGGTEIKGLRVNIASVLGSGTEALSLAAPALPLPLPGTMLLIAATTAGIILLILGGIGGSLWARKNLGDILEIRRKRRLVVLMRKVERRLRRKIAEGAEDYHAMLGLVSAEFRGFLEYLTGYNCRAMSAGEFFGLPPLFSPGPEEAPQAAELGGEYLGAFFRKLDRLRYSGEPLAAADVGGTLDGLRAFTEAIEKELRGRWRR